MVMTATSMEPVCQSEALTSRNAYSPEVAARIEAMGTVAVSAANRWILGWPARVTALLKRGIRINAAMLVFTDGEHNSADPAAGGQGLSQGLRRFPRLVS